MRSDSGLFHALGKRALERARGFESHPHRQLGNVFVGSPSARARQPILSANWNFLSFKVKFEPIFFQVFWQFFNLKGSLLRQRRTGVAGGRGVGGNSARHTNFGRNQFEFFLAKIRIPNFKIQSLGRAKRKGVGVSSPPGIFARLRFLIPIFPPPPNFVFCFAKCATNKEIVLAPPARAHTTKTPLLKLKKRCILII